MLKTLSSILSDQRRHSLSFRLLLYVLLFSSFFTLIVTCVQLYWDYRNDMNLIEKRFREIRGSYLKSLALGLWDLDRQRIEILLEGILRLPDMQYLEVVAKEGEILASVGDTGAGGPIISREFPLNHVSFENEETYLGNVRVVVTLEGVYERLREKVLVILVTQMFKTFNVSIFILFIFQYLVTRHLQNMADYARRIDLNHLDEPLDLNRRSKRKEPDELDRMVHAFNEMRVSLMRGIAKRRRAEDELRKAKDELEIRVRERTCELEEANAALRDAKDSAEAATKAKSEFLANMSHEIRTPLNGVIAATDLAMSEEITPGMERFLKIAHTSAYSLLGIINDILDFSKIEAGRLELEIRPFVLDSVLGNVMDMFGHKASEKNIELLIDMDLMTPKALIGDPLRLQQIVINLVANAIKFTDQGFVLVGVRCLEKTPDMVKLRFFIKDTGTGIPPDRLKMLFEPFTQADASTTRKYGGTGLGLSICKLLAEMMGGEIGVESSVGKGSTFSFTVEMFRQPNAKEKQLMFPDDLRNACFLIVDDCLENRTILKEILESFGSRADTVASGKEALAMLEKNRTEKDPYKLVIMDWLMPNMDGIGTSKKIRSEFGQEPPIIIMTAFGQEKEKQEAKKAGVDAFLTKPVSQSVLFETILGVCGENVLQDKGNRREMTTEMTVLRERLKGSKILLAEDNRTNQEIVKAIMKPTGIAITVADNGRKAVEAAKQNDYDLILMDVQMPEMDGFQATAAIRDWERKKNIPHKRKRIPIIAMTAHAMKGDEENCLKSGMDGYLSKPVNRTRLLSVLSRYILPSETVVENGAGVSEKTADTAFFRSVPSIDIPGAMARLDLPWKEFVAILRGFGERSGQTAANIREALKNKDLESVKNIAHNLKGAATNIEAKALGEAARNLENAILHNLSIDAVIVAARHLETELATVLKSLDELAEPQKEDRNVRQNAHDSEIAMFFKQTADALTGADPVEIAKHAEILKAHIPPEHLHELEKQIGNYEYDAALGTLSNIASGIGIPHK